MLDWLKSLCGKGKLVYDIKCSDGREARLKTEYIGSLDTMTEQDHLEIMRKAGLEHGMNIVSWEYLGDI